MDAAVIIGLGWLAFAVSHTLLSSEPVRRLLQAKIGVQPFRGLYSLVALATFIPLISYYGSHKHEGPLLWADGPRPITYTLMLLAVYFIASSILTPAPSFMLNPSTTVTGILKITRHPGFVGFICFALAHLVVNGYLSDVVFFGGLLVYTPFGAWHQDQRKRQEAPEVYESILKTTSFIPGLAIFQGRQPFHFRDISVIPVIATFFGVILLIQAHPYIAGVSLIQR